MRASIPTSTDELRPSTARHRTFGEPFRFRPGPGPAPSGDLARRHSLLPLLTISIVVLAVAASLG